MKIEEEGENEDEAGLHASLSILSILLILSAFSGQCPIFALAVRGKDLLERRR